MLTTLGEIESELTSKKYGLVWEQREEAVDVMMRDNRPVFTEVSEREITAVLVRDIISFMTISGLIVSTDFSIVNGFPLWQNG